MVRGSTSEGYFKVYNYGKCNVNFKIGCLPNSENASNETDVVIEPDIISLEPGNFAEVRTGII